MMNKGIVYYTDSQLNDKYAIPVRKQLDKVNLPIVSVSLQPLDWGDNIYLDLERGYLTMFKQILAGLKKTNSDVVFFAEHDILYHPSHFDFIPERDDTFYYNQNVWKVDAKSSKCLHYLCSQTSGLCAYRNLLLDHYERRVDYVEKNGFSRKIGFEPGTHKRIPKLNGISDVWMSEFPNIDIRHNKNLTLSRWQKDQFRNQKYTKGWKESDIILGWGKIYGEFDKILENI